MAIPVICPGCKARFKVSEKFAGKQGPCPKCKNVITIPEVSGDEIKVHEPQGFGPKGTSGQGVLKPIFREEVTVSKPIVGGIIGGIVAVFIVAFALRMGVESPFDPPSWLTPIFALGAILLAPPLVWGGYFFLHDSDLEAHRGRDLWIRIAICSAVYAFLWGLFAFVSRTVSPDDSLPLFYMLFLAPTVIGIGGFTALATFDLEYIMGCVHFGFYLIVTVLLRIIVIGFSF